MIKFRKILTNKINDNVTTFYSQQGEDFFIFRNFINLPTKDGIFLELGACDGLLYSNTMFFEKYLGLFLSFLVLLIH